MIRARRDVSESDYVILYCAAFRRAIRLRRELSIIARSSGMGGDRERFLGELADALAAMETVHDECVRVLRTRVTIPTLHRG